MLVHRRIPRRPVTPLDHGLTGPVAAIGIFDGVHRGHQAILRKAAVAITFHPHPLKVLHPEIAPPLLMPLPQRLEAIAECGIRAGWVIPFTRSFSRWSPERFVRELLVRRLGVRKVVVGYNFRFGAGRHGSVQTLERLGKRYGFSVEAVAPVRFRREKVSSGKLREWIRQGKLDRARRLMGGPAVVTGRVARGSGRGRKLGFATANLKVESGVLPPVGVYAVRASVLRKGARHFLPGTCFTGMANLGFRPTFEKTVKGHPSPSTLHPLLEVHLFGLSRPLYRKRLEVEFIRRLRGERRFASLEALARQIRRDAVRANGVLALQSVRGMV